MTIRILRGATLAAMAAVIVTGCTTPLTITAPTTPAAASTPAAATQPAGNPAADALAELPVKGRAPKTGYTRAQFRHWADPDRNGCDARADTLARQALPGTAVLNRDGCTIGAEIVDPYTGAHETEKAGPGSDVDVDHVVALSDAWQKGAQQLTPGEREQLANDPTNLLAVRDIVNEAKSDGDAATWLPPRREVRCEYVARQVAVKARYGLWVTAAERDAIARILDGCPGQPLPA